MALPVVCVPLTRLLRRVKLRWRRRLRSAPPVLVPRGHGQGVYDGGCGCGCHVHAPGYGAVRVGFGVIGAERGGGGGEEGGFTRVGFGAI